MNMEADVIEHSARKFVDLATVVLPAYMAQLRVSMAQPRNLNEFCTPGVGIFTLLKRLGCAHDFRGCYVLLRDQNPFYVGGSGGVIARLRQHVTGKTHFQANLAYSMACEKVPHEMTRDEAMNDQTFLQSFEDARQVLKDSSVAFIEIPNAVELYLFEAYCAMELNVSGWNWGVAAQPAGPVFMKLGKYQFVERRGVRDTVVAHARVDSSSTPTCFLESRHIPANDQGESVREDCTEEFPIPGV
jgi:hypothetical protein